MNISSVAQTPPDYLSVLNPEQKEAVIHTGSPLLILAGAGSGKTRVITTKIAYLIGKLGYDPRSILAVTFTKKAANEMAERARRLEPRAQYTQIRTFHSFGAWFLRLFAEEAGIDPHFTVYDEDDMVTLLTRAKPGLLRKDAAEAVHYISRVKDYCLAADADDFSPLDVPERFQELYLLYDKKLRETGNVDFGDLIMLPVRLLSTNTQIRSMMFDRFKVIMIDEYQDSNVAQFHLLQQLAGPETYICVVGDDDQSIYSFRGAEVENILTFQDHFAGTQIIRLERNYRSVEPILNTAGQVISCNTERLGKTLRAQREGGAKPVLAFLPNQEDEAAYCAELITRSHEKGCPYADWAVLYRTNAQSLSFETEFLHRKIPYTVVGSLKFYEREEIKDLLAFLKFLVNQKDDVAFLRIINKPARGIGSTTQEKITAHFTALEQNTQFSGGVHQGYLEACRTLLSVLPKRARTGVSEFVAIIDDLLALLPAGNNGAENVLAEVLAHDAEYPRLQSNESQECLSVFIQKIAERSGLLEYYKAADEIAQTQRIANIEELVKSADLYPLSLSGLLEFLDHIELDRILESETDSEKDAVTFITLHNTKGLEFPRVIITGLEAGVFPRADKHDRSLEEERRLFYVGITRARDELYLTSCNTRRLYGRMEFLYPSLFLYDIPLTAIRIIGNAPKSFLAGTRSQAGKHSVSQPHPLAGRWVKGSRIYHDEYGYGWIIKGECVENEYVITIQFENGSSKKFMPAYQSNSLTLIMEE